VFDEVYILFRFNISL